MDVSYENIVENENGYLVEINLEPRKSLTVVPEKLKNCKKRSPLKEKSELDNRLANAGKRKSQHLEEIKLKSKIDINKIKEKVQNNENERKNNILNKSNNRVKSAETKRSSLLKENIEKLNKHNSIVQEKQVEKIKAVENIKNKIDEKLQSAEQNRNEILNAKKSSKYVATLKTKLSK